MNNDVAIIGASSAGLFTAHLLAQRGVNVRVFEAKENINHSPRTLIVTSHLGSLTGSVFENTVLNRIRRFELYADGRVATISLRQPDLVIERSKLIQRLAELAEAGGVKILTGQRFSNVKPNGNRLSFTFTGNGNKEFAKESANILVGADGTFSKVAQKAGWPKQVTAPLLQAIVELPEDMSPDTARVWFVPEDTSYFYWLIPHSKEHGVLGLIAEDERQGLTSLKRFLERNDLLPIDFQSARTPLYRRWIPIHRRIGGNSVYLVGDAATHVKVTTVGGVVTGLRGAFGVAEAILNRGPSFQLLSLRRELEIHRLLRISLNSFSQTDYVKLLEILNPTAKDLLETHTRDEATKLLFHLSLRRPRVFLFGLRGLINDKIPLFRDRA